MVRKLFLILWLAVISGGISFLFWHNEWKYSLPTAVPKQYHPVNTETKISLQKVFELGDRTKPFLLHFFNPDCPCSRFNVDHVRSLIKQYDTRVNFVIVALTKDKSYTNNDIRDRFGLTVPVFFDSTIAAACGVYSTPQVAIIDVDHRLYYRGNYNKSRYCTDKKSNYAQIALDSLLYKNLRPSFAEAAIKSYGCQLPVCSK